MSAGVRGGPGVRVTAPKSSGVSKPRRTRRGSSAGKSCGSARARGSAYGYDDSGHTMKLGARARQLGRQALVHLDQVRELARVPLLEDADVGLHEAGLDLGRGGARGVDLVEARGAVGEIGDDERGGDGERAEGVAAAPGARAAPRVEERAVPRHQERRDAHAAR